MRPSQKPLNILLLSNLWPPHFIGGYELGAADIARRLEERGHRITVLTSQYNLSAPLVEGNVHRLLHEQVWYKLLQPSALLRETARAARRLPDLRRFLQGATFDLVYLFSPLGLSVAALQTICDSGRPVVAYVSDNWPAVWPYTDRLQAQWSHPRQYRSTMRQLAFISSRRAARQAGVLSRQPWDIPVRHAQFVSRYIRSISVDRLNPLTQEIIPWGIDVSRFPFRERGPEELTRWIYIGQVAEHKGPQTAIEAVGLLRAQGQPVTLTIYGDDSLDYGKALKDRVVREGLAEYVRFAGPLPRERLPAEAYDRGGLLVFPTMWEEPFSITLLEAFASGIPVLSTLTGGTGEIVRHGETATVFSVGNARHLGAAYYTMVRHFERAAAMARRAREIVARHLDIEAMVDRVEQHLCEVAEGRGSTGREPFALHPHPWEPSDLRPELPTRAIEPSQHDSGWLAALWTEIGLGTTTLEPEAEVDSRPDQLFPLKFPDSQVLNGRFRPYLRGLILNAGAGVQAVSAGERVVRLDLQIHNRPDICADLHSLPFRDASFDSIVSTAVLEHCRRPWVVMPELRRVLRPNGHLLLSVPFLQPSHANPSDYFRFTAEGLRELALDAGFTVVETVADNSTQHTVAWVLWELLRHHPRHRYLAWDDRVNAWFHHFSERSGRVIIPTISDGFCLLARRDA